jgi:membrane protein implicated in regulation of membrane protease activity
MEFIHSLGISLLYLTLLGIGLIYAVIILIAGAVHDLHIPGFEVNVGEHDFGPVDVHTVPDAHMGDVSHPSVKIPSLSPITIASFITAFGAFGLISMGLFDVSSRLSLAWAVIGGLIVAAIAHFAFGYFLIAPQGSSEVHLRDLVGTIAEVITPIPADSVGEVAFVAQGGRVTYTAKSLNAVIIARGTTVIIEKVIGGVAVVRPQ